ncbi:MAG TPA: NlpC/P60 family protein [Acidimicrobiales bacterium]|nr:NlpC/P60 family protein [Acidimicrobiales bacterium]
MKMLFGVIVAGSALAGPVLAAATALVAGPAADSPGAAAPPGGGGPLTAVPAGMLRLYVAAASGCAGLPWQVLAAIGALESASGTSDLPGVRGGHNPAGAEGPMQFEPATFAAYDQPVPPGGAVPPSPYDPTDAVYAAARMLCANGGGRPDGLGGAVYAYNHSAAYVARVLSQARSWGWGPPGATGAAGAAALAYALGQVGTPYRWGGETPGVGFDCSGLAQAAYAAAGVGIPRVAQDQFLAGPPVPPGGPLSPGDLVFFGSGPAGVTHVGLVVDPAGVMVDAPHAGADVRVESFPTVVGARWGGETYLGATAPG